MKNSTSAELSAPFRYRAIGLHNLSELPEWHRLAPDLRQAVEVVGQVLPFRTNRYVAENLIDWSRVPDDPIYQMVFPQRDMLSAEQFAEVRSELDKGGAGEAFKRTVLRIRRELNPHPAGQLTYNVPKLDGRPLRGLQHKYRETVVFFPSRGQTCYAYCTYCFRWAQFGGIEGARIESNTTADLIAYLKVHPEVTDVLITGGDPMVMGTRFLRQYIEPLLAPELDHVQNIRIGTKAVAYWPHRFVSDPDADDCLRLFEQVGAAGRHLAIMGHYSHPVEFEPDVFRQATRRIRETGAQIRMQAPLIKHVNDQPEIWATLWRIGVRLGLIPYYMFVERDTGPRDYFAVPLVRAHDIYRRAHDSVSGLSRSVQGPVMSAFPGKIRIVGVVPFSDMMDDRAQAALRSVNDGGARAAPQKRVFVCDFVQARDSALDQTVFFAAFDAEATWFDQLRPAFGRERFHFEAPTERNQHYPLNELTECPLS